MLPRRLLLAGGGGTFADVPIPNPRTYLTVPSDGGGAGGSTLYTPIDNPGGGQFARVMLSTPGLMQWWRLGNPLSAWGSLSAEAPFFANVAGASTLWSVGTVTAATGLLVGDSDGAANLASGYLEAFDYRGMSPGLEVMTAECWVKLTTLKTDTAIFGEWKSNDGWLLSATGADLAMNVGNSGPMTATGVLSTGVVLHIAAVFGGQEGPVPDYYSRIYVNGVDVAHGLQVASSGTTNNSNTRFQVGQYADGTGTNHIDGIVDEVALFSRMLQPNEVYQHYQAGLGLLWP